MSGRAKGAENVAKLKAYLDANRDRLPRFDGKLNKARIAKEAGVDRQIFINNPAAIGLLTEYGDASVEARIPTVISDAQAMEKIQRLEAQVSKFRDLAAKREVELAKRRRESAENETRLRVFEAMMETMRNVPMPPPAEVAPKNPEARE
jgi:hypothetical protein